MIAFERKIIDGLIKYKKYIFFILISLLAGFIRLSVRKFESADYEVCLKGWYYYFCDNGGLKGLSQQVGNYPIFYQFLIALMTYIPVNELYLYKMISIVFDFVLAIVAGNLVNLLTSDRVYLSTKFCVTYAVVLFLPTIFMNSSVWAQCDSIYSVFGLLCVYFLFKERFNISFIFLGIAFAFKIQTVFFLPFIFVYYFSTKKFSLIKIFISALSFWIMSLPGFIYGRSLLSPFEWLVGLTSDDKAMCCGMPNIWNIMTVNYDFFASFAIVLTVVILGLSLLYILDKNLHFDSGVLSLYYLAWSIWTCVIFLPGMHERYSYLLSIVLLVILLATKQISILICFIIEQLCIISTYMEFLYDNGMNIRLVSLIYISIYLYFSIMLYNEIKKEISIHV